jgi:hypothetical protein
MDGMKKSLKNKLMRELGYHKNNFRFKFRDAGRESDHWAGD